MLTFLDTAIGLLAPHPCLGCGADGSLLCSSCRTLLPDLRPQCYRCHATKQGWKTCAKCRKDSPLEYVWVQTSYDGASEALIKSLKFQRALAASRTIAESLLLHFGLPENAVLVPVPTATSRVRQRGYDQSVLIARRLASLGNIPYALLLERHGQQRQTGSTRRQRLAQLENAFHVRSKKLYGIESVILIDDVLTTGATLETAAKVLKRAGVKHVSALAFARAE